MKHKISFKVTLDVISEEGELSAEDITYLEDSIKHAIFTREVNHGFTKAEALLACKAVVDNWEQGDLAAAARQCQFVVDKNKS